jgi:hypothetical protein
MTKDIKVIMKPAADLVPGDYLVGDEGNLAAVFEVFPSSAQPGLMCVETEFGFLYLDSDPEQVYNVLDES